MVLLVVEAVSTRVQLEKESQEMLDRRKEGRKMIDD